MRIIIAMLLFPMLAQARVNYCSPWPYAGMIYSDLPNVVYDPPKPKKCYNINANNEDGHLDMTIAAFDGVKIIEDPLLASAKRSAQELDASKKAQEKADFAALKAKLEDDSASVSDMRKLLKLYLKQQ